MRRNGVVPSLSGHRIGIHGRHEALKDGHENGVPGVEVAVDGHGRHAQLAAQGAHGERTETVALDEIGGHGDNALAGERRTRLDRSFSGHSPSFLAHCEPGFYALVSQYRETARPAGRAAFFAIRNPEPSAALLQALVQRHARTGFGIVRPAVALGALIVGELLVLRMAVHAGHRGTVDGSVGIRESIVGRGLGQSLKGASVAGQARSSDT